MNSGVLDKCLNHFKNELKAFIVEEFKKVYESEWKEKAVSPPGRDTQVNMKKEPEQWDLICLLNLIYDHWDHVFSQDFNRKIPKGYFSIIRYFRNSWAHQNEIDDRELYRITDILENILDVIKKDSSIIKQERQQALIRLSHELVPLEPVNSIQDNIFLCYKCAKPSEKNNLYKCLNCHIIYCHMCMQNDIVLHLHRCPHCSCLLSSYEIEFYTNLFYG